MTSMKHTLLGVLGLIAIVAVSVCGAGTYAVVSAAYRQVTDTYASAQQDHLLLHQLLAALQQRPPSAEPAKKPTK